MGAWKKTLWAGVLVVGSLAFQGGAAAGGPETPALGTEHSPGAAEAFDERILWLNEEQTKALFLPQAQTVTASLEELPLKDYQREALEDTVRAFQNPSSGHDCIQFGPSPPQGSREDAKSLEDLIVEGDVALVGRVVRLVGGWKPWTLKVVTAAYIEVEELIHGSGVSGAPQPGAVIAITYDGGRTIVDGTEICADPREGFPIPLDGDRVLLSGKSWKPDPRFFYDVARFPVVDGEVRPEPRFDLKQGERARALGQLVRQVRVDGRSGSFSKGVER